MTHRPSWPVLLGAAAFFTVGASFAEPAPPTGDKEKAREWAEKANERFDARDYAGAVDAMSEAEKHYRAPTFARLRAEALEKLGRLVEARDVYRSIAAWDLPPNATPVWVETKSEAPGRAAALDARIPRLLILADGTPPPVTLDGAPLRADMLGTPVPRDPGKHILLAGEGAAAVRREVNLREGATERVTVAMSGGQGPRIGSAPAVAAFSAGAAGLLLGSILGGLAASKKDEVLTGVDNCGGACAAGEKVRLEGVLTDARAFAGVSTAGFVIAGVGAAAGVTLAVLSRTGGAGSPSIRVTTGSISLSGRF